MNPITGIKIDRGDQFLIQVWNLNPNATFLQARYVVDPQDTTELPVANQAQFNKTFGDDFDASGNLFQLRIAPPPGDLIDFSMNYGNNNVIGGQTYVTVYLENASGTIVTKLVDGYVYPGHGLDYPIRHIEHPYPVPRQGKVRTYTAPYNVAANPVTITPAAGRAWNVLQMQVHCVVNEPSTVFEVFFIKDTGIPCKILNVDFNNGDARVLFMVDVPTNPPLTDLWQTIFATTWANIQMPRGITLYSSLGDNLFLQLNGGAGADRVTVESITVEEFIQP